MAGFRKMMASSGTPGEKSRATVKWFDRQKGYGFVATENGDDAFLHVSQLQRAHVEDVMPGAELEVEVAPGPRGLQVSRLVEVISEGDPQQQPSRQEFDGPRRNQSDREEQVDCSGLPEISGKVRWFNDKKGFGFIAVSDGDDVFVHGSVLRRCGIDMLDEEQNVLLRCRENEKGRSAVWVAQLQDKA